jgi:hypothetical protein
MYVFVDAVCSFPLGCKDHESSTFERWLPKTAYDGDMKQVMSPLFCGPRHCLGKKAFIIYFIDIDEHTTLRSIAAQHTTRWASFAQPFCDTSTLTCAMRARIGLTRKRG